MVWFSPNKLTKARASKGTKLCIKLVCDKNALLERIEECYCLEERLSLIPLLTKIKSKSGQVRKAEKARMKK